MKIPFQQYWDLLARFIRPQMGRFILLSVLLFSSIGLQLANPQVMRYFIDATQTQTALHCEKAIPSRVGDWQEELKVSGDSGGTE